MPAVIGKKRKSEGASDATGEMERQMIPTKRGDQPNIGSPMKKRRAGITLAQKQALIENLQLEITERARKLRSNYNIHAQTLRTRVEIRVHRISRPLRNITMGELLQKYTAQQQQHKEAARGPPVPAKDSVVGQHAFRRPLTAIPGSSARPTKRTSHEMSGGDKENEMETIDMPKKKARAGPATELTRTHGQVLSPASSNSRLVPRGERAPPSPVKSGIARPVSPTKMASATNLLSNMVEKARSSRTAATNRKATTSTTASSSNGSTSTAATRVKRGAAAQAAPPPARPATRTARRVSVISESSDGSTSTVVRKRPGTAMSTASKAPAAKRTVMSTIKKGVGASTTTKKAPASAAKASQAAPATGRVLRKRT
ncbi:Borealin N terminal-domain-containing protein [Podospora aff. communis PSN243]|uniref:Borealin N terminal-domain-containing protein n=1 Tax=Podospora aff. communis PSN243 TaxID=3040156 RepID=A0AAV9GNB1_9PEZI|nr:Borealin N terminal-domain-containing protein [Podospora aff. communis PSN243]